MIFMVVYIKTGNRGNQQETSISIQHLCSSPVGRLYIICLIHTVKTTYCGHEVSYACIVVRH